MINRRTHRINKVVVSINCASRHRTSVSDLGFSELIAEALEKIEVIKSDRLMRIDKAFISIGLDSNNLPVFENSFGDILAEKLEILIKDPQICEIIEEARDRKNAVFSFLEDANLPWYVRALNLDEATLNDTQFLDELKRLLREKPQLSRRLLFRADEVLRRQLFIRLTGGNFSYKVREVSKILSDHTRGSGSTYDAAYRSELIFAAQMLEKAVSDRALPNFDRILKHIWPDVISEIAYFSPGSIADLTRKVSSTTGLKLRASSGISSKVEKTVISHKAPNKSSSAAERKRFEPVTDSQVDLTDLDSLQVENAGLILLHPFLKSLFEKTGLLNNGKFQDNSRKERAVCLLHYLATGTQRFPDEQLSMPKFISNYPREYTVPLDLPISPYEITECDNMLRQAIGHWKALRNTSLEGFRFNFLRRKGVLKKDMHGYLLYMEKETADVLLARLPWPISPVRFPWRPDLITVKWD